MDLEARLGRVHWWRDHALSTRGFGNSQVWPVVAPEEELLFWNNSRSIIQRADDAIAKTRAPRLAEGAL